MSAKRRDVVSASEVAAWAWCPEAWRLDALGEEPGNWAALDRGRALHARTSAVEVWSRRAARLGRWLLALALLLLLLLLLAAVGYLLAGGTGR